MSVSTPYKGQVQTPFSNPDHIDYFNSWRLETDLPHMVMSKAAQIVGEYYHLKPQLNKRQNEMQILFKYNKKLVEKTQEFIAHEKKIVNKYNALCKLYIDSFQKYCNAKNLDMNFNVKPIKTVFQNFNITDWKYHQNELIKPQISQPYENQLLNTITKHFLNQQQGLEKKLKEIVEKNQINVDSQERMHIEDIKLSIKQLSQKTATTENMFDLLNQRKLIEYQIRQLDQKTIWDSFQQNDNNFISQITSIHRELFEIKPEKMKEYLENETIIRKKLKRKHKKMRDELQTYFQKLESENYELKQQVSIQKKKRQECEKQRSQFKSLYEYMQLKGASNSRHSRPSNNYSLYDDSSVKGSEAGMKQTSKKPDIRISELEIQIKQLKLDIQNKEAKINTLVEQQNQKFNTQQLVKKRLLQELDYPQLQYNSSNIGLYNLLEKVLQKKAEQNGSSIRKLTPEQSEDRIDIVITESVQMQAWKSHLNLKAKVEPNQHIQEASSSIEQAQISKHDMSQSKSQSQSKSESKSSSRSQSKSDKWISTSAKAQTIKGKQELSSIKQNVTKTENNVNFTKKPSANLAEIELLSISEKNLQEEESKHIIDISKMVKHTKTKEERASDSLLQNSKEEEQIIALKQKIESLTKENEFLSEQVFKLKQQIKQLEGRLADKDKLGPRSLISSGQQLRNTDMGHAQQIETLCNSIAKELNKFQGEEFQKILNNMEGAIKHCGLGDPSPRKGNMNGPPMLSKNLQEDNVFKSDNMLLNFVSKMSKEQEQKPSKSQKIQRGERLALRSGEVKLHFNQLNQEKSIYFDAKEPNLDIHRIVQTRVVSAQANKPKKAIQKQSKELQSKLQQVDDIIEGVQTFNNGEGVSLIKKKNKRIKESDHSLKLSNTNLKNSFEGKQSDLKQESIKMGEPSYLDSSYVARLEKVIDNLRNNKDDAANDVFWFYKKYKQAIEALQRTQGLVRAHEAQKQECMNKLTEQGTISRHKLQEQIYFLQQRVAQLQAAEQQMKQQYENVMTQQLKAMEQLKEKALQQLGINFLTMGA